MVYRLNGCFRVNPTKVLFSWDQKRTVAISFSPSPPATISFVYHHQEGGEEPRSLTRCYDAPFPPLPPYYFFTSRSPPPPLLTRRLFSLISQKEERGIGNRGGGETTIFWMCGIRHIFDHLSLAIAILSAPVRNSTIP